MGLIIDTSIFIAHERGRLDLHARVRELPEDTQVAISAITASELLHGVHRAEDPARRVKRQAFVQSILNRVPCVPFDISAAHIHAQISALLASKGTPVGAHDLIIGTTAVSLGYDVVTRDLRSFPRIPGLSVISW